MSPFAKSSNHAQDSINGAMEDWNVTRLSTLVTSSQEQTEETEVFKTILRYLGYLLLKFVSVISCSSLSSPVRPRQDQPMNAIRQFHFMEVEQESDGYVKQLHVAEQLRFVNRQHFLHGLSLD